ncbi:MAG: hypothetical protein ACLU3I_14860, partial [Acutalibacteraceae bacterium]
FCRYWRSAAWTGTNGKARRAFVSKLFFGNNLQKQRHTNSVLSLEFVCLLLIVSGVSEKPPMHRAAEPFRAAGHIFSFQIHPKKSNILKYEFQL